MYDKNEIEKFFKHGEETITNYQYGDRTIEKYDYIFCTEKGTIAFILQNKNLSYTMKYGGSYGNGFAIIQYCTDNQNNWTKKIHWITEDYWNTIKNSYNEITY